MHTIKSIGLVAHDARKKDLLDWVRYNILTLCRHRLFCTGTTGTLILRMAQEEFFDLPVDIVLLKSGPLGGDQQMGALIAEEKIDILIFLIDPMTTQPHDVDVKALVRLCTVYNTVVACTPSTADFIISSPLFDSAYKPKRHDYTAYLERETARENSESAGQE